MAGIPSLLSGSLPPKRGDHEGQYVWQWWVFLKLSALLLFAAWALGLFATVGFQGLARASDVDGLRQEVRDGRIEDVGAKIFEMRVKQCNGETPVVLRQALGEQIAKQMLLYFQLSGEPYQLQNCDELR